MGIVDKNYLFIPDPSRFPDGLINDTMSKIFDALKIKDTNKSFDKIIDQALAGDNWIDNPPPASEHYLTGNPSGLTPHKPMPSSSKIKNLGPKYFTRDEKQECFNNLSAKEA